MLKKVLPILLFVAVTLSCKDKTVKTQEIKKPEMYTVTKHSKFLPLLKISESNITNWKEYKKVSNSLKKFFAIKATEALDNAIELSKEIKLLKDSIRPKELQNLSFKTRLNVLENEVLRLKDMTYITSITAKEVNNQVDKILSAFSATNSKINTVYSQLEVEKEILIKNKN